MEDPFNPRDDLSDEINRSTAAASPGSTIPLWVQRQAPINARQNCAAITAPKWLCFPECENSPLAHYPTWQKSTTAPAAGTPADEENDEEKRKKNAACTWCRQTQTIGKAYVCICGCWRYTLQQSRRLKERERERERGTGLDNKGIKRLCQVKSACVHADEARAATRKKKRLAVARHEQKSSCICIGARGIMVLGVIFEGVWAREGSRLVLIHYCFVGVEWHCLWQIDYLSNVDSQLQILYRITSMEHSLYSEDELLFLVSFDHNRNNDNEIYIIMLL